MTTATSVYLDHAATSPVDPESAELVASVLAGGLGNPSGLHERARRARRALDDAREELAAALGCRPEEIIFTSGATEADNLALSGVVTRAGALVVSAIEHAAVLRPAAALGSALLPVLRSGIVRLDALPGLLDARTELVSVMAVNSETGAVQPIAEVVAAARAYAPHALVHCDAAQALRWCALDRLTADCELVSLSGHKFGAPAGIGALVVRGGARERLRPLLVGGGQEQEWRAGTPNLAGALAMARAATRTVERRARDVERIAQLAARLEVGASLLDPAGVATVAAPRRVAGICHLRFPGIDGEELVMVLDRLGVCASTGSACAAGATEPSHVLLAMGYDKREAREGVRFSLGTTTTAEEIELTLDALDAALAQLRR